MASVQQAGGVNELNDKQKAAIEEASKEALSELENEIKLAITSQPQLAKVAGLMKYAHHQRPIMLKRTHNYSGEFLVNPPQTMGKGGNFLHMGAHSLAGQLGQFPVVVGSKAYVIYGTFDKVEPGVGYLLAWSKPANDPRVVVPNPPDVDLVVPGFSDSKVLIIAGELSKIMGMDDKEIESKLDASSNYSESGDSYAMIKDIAVFKDLKLENNLAVLTAFFA